MFVIVSIGISISISILSVLDWDKMNIMSEWKSKWSIVDTDGLRVGFCDIVGDGVGLDVRMVGCNVGLKLPWLPADWSVAHIAFSDTEFRPM